MPRRPRWLESCDACEDLACRAASGSYVYGDVTGDCGFTLSDLDFIKRHMAGDPPSAPNAAQLSTMDIDYDDDIDANDVTFILLALAKKYRFLAPADGHYTIVVYNRSAGIHPEPRRGYRLSLRREVPATDIAVIPPGTSPTAEPTTGAIA